MDKKCSKYEGLFVFSNEETFNKHLEECEECRLEHETMEKVSGLINEVKFYYTAKRRTKRKLKAVCAAIMLIFFSATFGICAMDDDFTDELVYGETLTAEDLGFPVDSYGLLMVGE